MDKNCSVKNYMEFKARYLQQYSQPSILFLENLEKKEFWAIDVTLSNLVDTYRKLPSVCKKPFDEHDSCLIENLIKLLSYLPFTESIASLAYLGFDNEDYGLAIYEVAYEGAKLDRPCEHSSVLIQRASVINRIAMIQVIQGRKL